MSDESWTPPTSPFNPRAERQAFRWAVIRAGVWALVMYFVLTSLLGFTSAIAFHFVYPSSMDRFKTALEVAHPELESISSQGRGTFSWRNVTISSFSYLEAGELQHAETKLERTLWGSASAELPHTALTDALALGRVSLEDSRTYLAGLPKAALTDAVVELRSPSADPLDAVFHMGAPFGCAQYMENPFTANTARTSSPTTQCGGIADFRRWVRDLGRRDDAVLKALLLPRRADLQRMAHEGLVYGYYLRALTVAEFGKLLADPHVASVTPVKSAVTVSREHRDQTAPPPGS